MKLSETANHRISECNSAKQTILLTASIRM